MLFTVILFCAGLEFKLKCPADTLVWQKTSIVFKHNFAVLGWWGEFITGPRAILVEDPWSRVSVRCAHILVHFHFYARFGPIPVLTNLTYLPVSGPTFQAMLLHQPIAWTQCTVPVLSQTRSPGRWIKRYTGTLASYKSSRFGHHEPIR